MNAGISRDLGVSKEFLDSMLKIHGHTKTGDTTEQDEILLKIKNKIYKNLPNSFDIELAQKKYPVQYSESMNTVLIQEMKRFNILLQEIKVSLQFLEKAVKGLVVMTPDLEVFVFSIQHSRILKTEIIEF